MKKLQTVLDWQVIVKPNRASGKILCLTSGTIKNKNFILFIFKGVCIATMYSMVIFVVDVKMVGCLTVRVKVR